MPTAARARQFLQAWDTFLNLKPEEFLAKATFSDYDGPNQEETRQSLLFLASTIAALATGGMLERLPWSALSALQGALQNVHNQYNQLLSTRDQGSYQNFAIQLDVMANQARALGLTYLTAGGANIEQTKAAVDSELARLTKSNAELELLKKDVKNLITPAVAGSLSKAFSERCAELVKERRIWLLLSLVIGALVVNATYNFVDAISLATSTINLSASSFWTTIVGRSVILIPLIIAFGFVISQYRKERDFEEEYAHKAAVAISLPNYGELASEAVRDQIVTGAVNVIFSSPTAHSAALDKSQATIGGMKEMLDTVVKLVKK
jgi:hypothetical protein